MITPSGLWVLTDSLGTLKTLLVQSSIVFYSLLQSSIESSVQPTVSIVQCTLETLPCNPALLKAGKVVSKNSQEEELTYVH